MAEVICMARTNGTDPGQWKEGDVVAVVEDGHLWAKGELDPAVFVIVSIPGKSRDEVSALVRGEQFDEKGVMVSRSKMTLDAVAGFADKEDPTVKVYVEEAQIVDFSVLADA